MIVLLKKILIFITPFIILLALEIFIDPYNYFSIEKNGALLKIKQNIASKKNDYLYTLIEYGRNPSPVIILGDSRARTLLPKLFEEFSNEKVSNLSGTGGSLQDIIKIFWDVSKKQNLKKIYLGVSIETYNGLFLKDKVSSSIDIINSVPLYLLNKYTLETTMLIYKSRMFNEKIDLGKPPFTKEEFWKLQIDFENQYLGNYSYPKNYYEELKKITDYCSKNNIKLVFFISPTHTELQNKINELALNKENDRFKNDIRSLGDLYDFNLPNVITSNKNNFLDPRHCTDSVSRIIIKEMVLNRPEYSVFTKHTTPAN
jgi:hypothetical protein